MKFFRVLLKVLLGLLLAVVLFVAVSVAPVDDTPYQQTDYYAQTRRRLASLPAPPRPKTALRAGWSKINITPPYTTPTGGYGVRRGKHWTTVHDSVYVRTIVLDNGSAKIAVIALDLLITPPTVTEQLKRRLPDIGFRWEEVYTGAIHSHNSLGGWAPGLVGGLFAGEYEERIVTHLTDAILKSITAAQQNLAPAEIGYQEVEAPDLINNRLNRDGPVDRPVRLLKFKKPDGSSALLCSYSAHATIFHAMNYQPLSRDYPGALVDRLEKESGGFVAFLAGAVGSTSPRVPDSPDDLKVIGAYADSLTARITPALASFPTRPDSTLEMLTLPLGLREPHARVTDGWRVRPWLFHTVYGDFPSDLKALRIGRTVLLGTPCDFSGELVAGLKPAADRKGLNLMVTSFNGGYVGYITPDKYYHKTSYEIRTMNWFGPYNGAYFTEMLTGLIGRL
ncbi:neutral/alkaline non-lysosomal ceramidase N-terminal domain-containing protein [Larkinella soli]|uniref:neutral/alkaline non-lysosomal ceramidase N-terminal domain-containing protein n=1 Tax=Larkinella soli TaxID=1770527 RepID=UPI000FFB2BA4|nr:neutral/alkaline non-lysosomal ceramidase N-terminal domain-containing protein [Larkinella soli]